MGVTGGRALVPPLPEPVEADAEQTGNRLSAIQLSPLASLNSASRSGKSRGKSYSMGR